MSTKGMEVRSSMDAVLLRFRTMSHGHEPVTEHPAYGGSSLVTNFMLAALLLRVSDITARVRR